MRSGKAQDAEERWRAARQRAERLGAVLDPDDSPPPLLPLIRRPARKGKTRKQRMSKKAYAAYLVTPEWRERARLVMERANYLCEGCRKSRATEVHHITYDHVCAEFLWELYAVCGSCHARFHGKADK